MPTHYEYKPLSTSRSIRILRLQPNGKSEAPIRITLDEVNLDGQDLYFEALSYAWGEESGSCPIFCDGQEIRVTPNCNAALCMLRRKRRERYLWIDAICINQSSISEKNAQVLNMSQIYGNAAVTLVWLGGSGLRLGMAARLVSLSFRCSYFWIDIPYFFTLPFTRSISSLLGGGKNRPLSWSYRCWTLQELCLSRKVLFLLGPGHICERSLNNFVFRKRVQSLVTWERRLDARWNFWSHEARSTYADFLCHVEQHCRNPRDRVYGQLALLERLGYRTPRPDYDLSPEDVYSIMAKSICESDSDLDILRYSSRKKPPYRLPTWVPDWGFDTSLLIPHISGIPPPPSRQNATNDSKFTAVSGLPVSQLQIRGFTFGNVDVNGPAVCPNDEPSEPFCIAWADFLVSEAARILGNDKSKANMPPGIALAATEFLFHIKYIGPKRELKQHQDRVRKLKEELRELVTSEPDEHFHDQDMKADVWTEYSESIDFIFFRTGNYIGLAPDHAKKGDLVVLAEGQSLPLLIRSRGEHFEFVSLCYIYGIMEGEAWTESAKSNLRDFILV